MAQALEVKAGTKLELDQYDREFIRQAVEKDISPATAIRVRYTTLLRDKTPDGGMVAFPPTGGLPSRCQSPRLTSRN